MKYYVKHNGKTYGPVDENKIRTKVFSGFFSMNSLVSADQKEWVPLPQMIVILRPSEKSAEIPKVDSPHPHMQLSEDDVVHSDVIPMAEEKKSFRLMPIAIAAVLVFLLIGGGAGTLIYYYYRNPSASTQKGSPKNFQQVCRQYQSAVGVVTVILEDSNRKLLNSIGKFTVGSDYPIGTAFAISKNQFATNCHVAYGIRDQKSGVLESVLERIVLHEAIKDGIKTVGAYQQYREKYKNAIDELRKHLHKNVKVRDVEIRLAHTGGRSLQVSGVQIHPRYRASTSTHEEEYKNGEFDVAILTTTEDTECFFRIAPLKKLYSLEVGQEIAYIGFPMEGLADNGDLDLNRPEAIFKPGTINRITDFNKINSVPEFNKSITHDIPAAGGASGSPIFLPNGEVIAILWGVSHTGQNSQGRVASATQHNMAVRIDSLDNVKKQTVHQLKDWIGEKEK